MEQCVQGHPMGEPLQRPPMQELPQRFPTVKKVNTRDQLVRQTKKNEWVYMIMHSKSDHCIIDHIY